MQGGIIAALLVSSATSIIAIGIKALTLRGGIAMWLMGFWIYLSLGWKGFLIPVVFFALASCFTKMGYERKCAKPVAERRGGQRGVKEVLANGIVPLVLTVPIVLTDSNLFRLGYVGAWATALCDTSSTELGVLWGRKTFLIKSRALVPPGASGAISLEGTAAGLAAALLLVLVSCAIGLVPVSMVLPIGFAALLGTLAESWLGEVIPPGQKMKHEILNVSNTAIGGGLALLWGRLLAKA